MTEVKDEPIKVKVWNNRIRTMMKQRSIFSIRELAERMGEVGMEPPLAALVRMTLPSRRKDGNWTPLAHRLAKFFRCLPEDLFIDSQQWEELEDVRTQAEVMYLVLHQTALVHYDPERQLQLRQLRDALHRALSTLTPREERVLRMRFGLGHNKKEMAQEEVADTLGISSARIGQIERKALQKLRREPRAKALLYSAASSSLTRSWWGGKSHPMDMNLFSDL